DPPVVATSLIAATRLLFALVWSPDRSPWLLPEISVLTVLNSVAIRVASEETLEARDIRQVRSRTAQPATGCPRHTLGAGSLRSCAPQSTRRSVPVPPPPAARRPEGSRCPGCSG